ncbi:MAG: hypothetical protein EBW87_05615 [Burkholderiaceae bacterium]|nr:hypothetical protein [Burkholderiaceae bacterium]
MDLQVERIFYEHMKNDTSFQEKDSVLSMLFGTHKYTKHEMRDTWDKGIKLGISIGLRSATIEGQTIALNANTKNPKHIEFLEKFYKLADEYNCAIQYHHELGMIVVSREKL